ncbi:putative phage protein gp47/JayE [Herbaspirillum sp. Sphag1AN]|uniref:baseplate J/gp47 family protein n=1 Tax=unclassified Herbaspirillum TaxID=2624150 RepID=UPI00161E3E66|nr:MULTISPECIES: baseplate J/gp47 family protein [unclassified Herbaspirillum]MBB3213416.1 putative phage protein gp47/JayE [Herbaspirillum sp. Sphag1AN]MBB3246540.1 putative phage protein gp47/JayE [Herbaspirillum sp. Sphag64]
MQTYSFNQIVQNFATAVQGSTSKLVNFGTGSVLLAIAQAMAGVGLWLQGMILTLLAVTRASTSSGTDLDTWLADFGFTRLAANASSGQVIFARYTPTAQAFIPAGTSATVQSADGSVQFAVLADTTNTAYNATLGGYVLPAGQASISVTVQCLTAGSVGNVAAGAISSLVVAISGVDTVTNAVAFTNGYDAETDAAARSRFILYLAGLSKATLAAIGSAILSVEQGLTYKIIENQTFTGTTQAGLLTVVVDDGTGAPSSTLKSSVAAAVESTRAAGVTYGVYGPTLLTATVVMTITTSTATGAPSHSAVAAIVQAAILSYINSLAMGVSLQYSYLATIAYSASSYVTNVTSWTLNGGTSDLTATGVQEIKSSSVTVN